MPERIPVAAVQLGWKHHTERAQAHDDLYRYLRLARTKGAELVVLPELSGFLVAPALQRPDQQATGSSGGFWQRLRGAGRSEPHPLRQALPLLVSEHSDELLAAYLDLFSPAAREHATWLVAGSLFMREAGGPVHALAALFDANGALVGWQSKLHLSDGERALALPGDDLQSFATPWGRLGILLGSDMLYPELGRALAYRGVDLIANPVAATSTTMWKRLRLAAAARAQENQLFVAQSFLLGPNEVTGAGDDAAPPFVGRSALFAPIEMTARGDAILAEMGTESAEGVVAEVCDLARLHTLWQEADERPREALRGPLFAQLLAFDYESGATLNERAAEASAQTAHRARAATMAVQRTAWGPPPPPTTTPAEFLDAIEAEVGEIADIENARDIIDAADGAPPV